MRPAIPDLEPLVVAAAEGDQEAFARLVGVTSGVVSSIALAILRDLDASRDVAQDVFLAAWRDLRKLRNPASFLPWLRQLTRNRAHHVLRTHVRTRRRHAESIADTFLESVADPRPDASVGIVAREDAAVLEGALSQLPDDTREVLTLFYREGQSVAQAAGLLDLTESAVKKRLSRARQLLRESLLNRAAATLRATAPGVGFTAAVMTALSIGAPASASAATIVVSKGLGNAGLLGKLLLTGVTALPGAAGGVAGVLLGSRHLVRVARDEEERRGIRRYRITSSTVVAVLAFAMPLGVAITGWTWWPVADFIGLIAALAWMQHVWLPRIVRRRLEAEMREDPVAATARLTRERRVAFIGWSLGLTLGTLGLIAGMWMTVGR